MKRLALRVDKYGNYYKIIVLKREDMRTIIVLFKQGGRKGEMSFLQ